MVCHVLKVRWEPWPSALRPKTKAEAEQNRLHYNGPDPGWNFVFTTNRAGHDKFWSLASRRPEHAQFGDRDILKVATEVSRIRMASKTPASLIVLADRLPRGCQSH